ncbi:type III CRISPR-associated RAMP protein Csx7 [Caldicoprobacter faecalis]|uniref:CRISPR-associated protein, Csx7 family n=1 Tax=Caldicoprobacter faecalis TaxID=937334 RepID=A0A1I5T1U0_9FIRM|nr:CRISPR-associated RAMP protein Csx7 [Caldicoprobacter faecalis]PZN08453.1 MAG: CRISPR-associated RAMP protein [Caldicoprobacter oshimai]SFP76938.1 CRISPR-associated protein, Csx7 family [Caldicoprobacter faecalis]
MLLDRFYNKYIIKGTLIADTPIHIGSGEESFDPVQVDNSVIRDSNGNPYIPGSSLKGVLRSYLETLLISGVDERFNACLIVNEPCLDNDDVKSIKETCKSSQSNQNVDRLVAEEIYKKMCTVCRIFGNQYFASKLVVNDCTLKEDKAYVERRDGVGIDRDTGTAADKKKYTFEQLAAGAKFDFCMTVDNLEPEYEELLKLMINVLKSGELRVGGKTSVGLGCIRLTDVSAYKIEHKNLKQYLLEGLKDEMRWQYV